MEEPRRHVPNARRNLLLGVLGMAAAAGAGVYSAKYLVRRRQRAAVTTVALVYPAPRPLPAFALIAADGSDFDATNFRGHYTFVLFGYTNCPDVCPTTLLELRRARALLADLAPADLPAVALVTVDPKRDTPARVGEYARHFDPAFIGLSGSEAGIDALARGIGVAIQRGAERDGSYSVDHTAAVFLVDDSARVTAVFPTPHEAKSIAADYRAIRAAAGGRRG